YFIHLTDLRALSADTTGKLNVLRHDGHTLGVNGAQVGVLEQTHQVRLRCLLKSQHGGALETEVTLEVLRDLADKTLEGKLADEKVRRLLVATDLAEGNSSGTVAMGLLHSSCGRRGLAGGFGGELLTRGLSSGRFAGGLLGTSHCCGLWLLG
ncbi:hypothetical protein ACHAXS_010974, partial [Conticribra weissflogii]